MVRRLLRRIFGRKPRHANGQPEHAKHAVIPKEEMVFMLKQLGFQSKYVPTLTKIHNRLLTNMEFHSNSTVPIITGKQELDTKLQANMQKMMALEHEINRIRVQAIKGSYLEKTKKMVDAARKLENKFNRLKAANLTIFAEAFAEKKKQQ